MIASARRLRHAGPLTIGAAIGLVLLFVLQTQPKFFSAEEVDGGVVVAIKIPHGVIPESQYYTSHFYSSCPVAPSVFEGMQTRAPDASITILPLKE